jgi:hypothetical protein
MKYDIFNIFLLLNDLSNNINNFYVKVIKISIILTIFIN